MANQLIPEPSLMPPIPEQLNFDERAALWADLVNTADELLLAGLRRDVGATGDVHAAYRIWYARQMEERDRYWQHFAERFCRAGVKHGR